MERGLFEEEVLLSVNTITIYHFRAIIVLLVYKTYWYCPLIVVTNQKVYISVVFIVIYSKGDQMTDNGSILDGRPKESIEVLLQPSCEVINYPEQPLPTDNFPVLIHYKASDLEIEITDIKEGKVIDGVLFGKVKFTKYHEQNKPSELDLPIVEVEGKYKGTPKFHRVSVNDDSEKHGNEFKSSFYVPLLDSEKIIEYILQGLSKDEINYHQIQWFEPLQQALRPCNDYTLRNAAYNEDPIVDLLKAEGLKTTHSVSDNRPTITDVNRMVAKAFEKVNTEFNGYRAANKVRNPKDIN